MKVGIKYCGGCNPTYRREKVEEVLREEFPEVHFTYFTHLSSENLKGLKADLVVCISGCKKGCAEEAVVSAIKEAIKEQDDGVPVLTVDEEMERETIIAEFKRCLELR